MMRPLLVAASVAAFFAVSTTACDAVPEVAAWRGDDRGAAQVAQAGEPVAAIQAPTAATGESQGRSEVQSSPSPTSGALVATIVPVAGKPVLWGYVDGAGIAHFATSQIDSRYAQVLRETDGPRVIGKTQGTDGLLTWLEISPDVKAVQPLLDEAARATGVDEELLKAVITVESSYNPRAVSPRGAVGLMQLTPVTADRYGTKQERQTPAAARMLDARINILTGARMLADLTRRYGGIDIALAAWNAGEGTVRRAGGRMPEIAETEAHVHMVLELYWALLQRNLPQHAHGVEVVSCEPAVCGQVRR